MKYTLKKLLAMVLTLFGVSFLVYASFSLLSGDPATAMLGTQATPERVEALREQMGLNDPLPIQYIRWATAFLTGDMGTSYSYQIPVSEMVGDKIPITLTLTFMAFVMVLLLAVPLGIYTARHEGGRTDRLITVCNQVIMAVPPFFSGILITLIFGRMLRLFTPGGYVSWKESPGEFLAYLLFPALAVALPKAAMTIKLLRSSLLTEVRKDYVRTAYSRGNGSNRVFYVHILKNAWIPVITFLGMALADMVAGSIIIEQVFSIPGLGRILLTSISNRDYPVVEAIIICIACIVIGINLAVDLIYQWIDPRISVDNNEK